MAAQLSREDARVVAAILHAVHERRRAYEAAERVAGRTPAPASMPLRADGSPDYWPKQ
jgi:hypothetical protein